jgi:hypothetical protein
VVTQGVVDEAGKSSGKYESDSEDESEEEETLPGDEEGIISLEQSMYVSKEKKDVKKEI